MQLDRPAQDGQRRRRFRELLIWSSLTLLAALALALAMVIASLALELGPESAPSPTSPTQFRPAGGHSMLHPMRSGRRTSDSSAGMPWRA
jgi:hypothetical protein